MKLSKQAILLRKIARELRYGSLDEAINREVVIHEQDSIARDILSSLTDVLPAGCKFIGPESEFLEGAIAKYGIIDATLVAPGKLIESYSPIGVFELKNWVLFLKLTAKKPIL